MTLLTKEQFFSKELQQENFDCTPLGINGHIIIQEMSGNDRDRLEVLILSEDDTGNRKLNFENMRAKTLALSCINEDGSKFFTIDEVHAIGKTSGKMIVEMYKVAKRLSGLGDDETADEVKK